MVKSILMKDHIYTTSWFCFCSTMRDYLPDEVGGVLWFATDDANMALSVYCCATEVSSLL